MTDHTDDDDFQHEAAGGVDFDDADLSPVPEPEQDPNAIGLEQQGDGEPQPEITDESSSLASKPGKNIILFGILGIASIIFIYKMIFQEDEAQIKKEEMEKITASQPVDEAVEPTRPVKVEQSDVGTIDTPAPLDLSDLNAPPALDLEAPPLEAPSDQDIQPFGGFEPDFLNELDQADEAANQPVPTSAPQPGDPNPPTQQGSPQPAQQPAQPNVVNAQPALPSGPDPTPEPAEVEPTGPTKEEIAARRRSIRKGDVFVMSSGKGLPSSTYENATDDTGKPITANVTLSHTSAQQVTVTDIGETDFIIAQGKMIDAVLETAINTNLAGMLRAVVTRDVYGETGSYILIPKGSRLIGTYNNSVDTGQYRVEITWDRVIRPDGIDIAINSPATDRLGRAGVSGSVDNKYFELFANSVLLSILNIGSTVVLDEFDKTSSTTASTTTSADGNTTTSQTGTPVDFAVMDQIQELSDVASQITENILDQEPVITINQGTQINVFVNQDIVFPKEVVLSGSLLD